MKKILSFILIATFAFSLAAADIVSVIAKAKENSPSMQYTNSNYEYGKKVLEASDKKEGFSYGISLNSLRLAKDVSVYPSATFSVTLPEFADDLKITGSLSTSYSESVKNYNVVPSIDVSKSFTFKSYEDTREDLTKESNELTLNSTYEKTVNSFESTLINSAISILELKKNIISQTKYLERLEDSLEKSLAIGDIDSGSLSEIDAKKNIIKAQSSLDSLNRNLKTSIDSFENTYGINYEDITEAPDSNLSFTPNTNDSVSLRNKWISLQTAKQNLEEKTGKTTSLSVGAGATPAVVFDKDCKYSSISVGTTANATLKQNNLSITAQYNGTSTKDSYQPTLTISGSWKNNAKPYEDENEVLKLQNAYLKAQNDYDDAVYSYNKNASDLQNEITAWYEDLSNQEIDEDYNLRVLEYSKSLFLEGYITETDLSDAQTAVTVDAVNRIILKLKAMVIANEIKNINL